jgi:phosphoglycerate dehydrogenase-like enzyme
MTMRVAILDDYQHVAAGLADWDGLDADVEFFHDTVNDHAALVARLAPFDVIVAMRERTPFPAELVAALPNLGLLVTTGMRNASIDVGAAAARDITVCGTESFGHATAELSFALLQMCARGLFDEVASVRAGGWQVGLGRDLRGATLGLIGLGRIGTMMAGYGNAFGMHVIAWSENLTPQRCAEAGVEAVTKDDLLARSDFVSIHVRSSNRTEGLIGSSELAKMKPDAYLINTSRSAIVDTRAMLAALDTGQIAGAATDVFDDEPMTADDPVRSHPRIITTPHIGYVTRETYDVFYTQALEDITAWQSGAPIRVIHP